MVVVQMNDGHFLMVLPLRNGHWHVIGRTRSGKVVTVQAEPKYRAAVIALVFNATKGN